MEQSQDAKDIVLIHSDTSVIKKELKVKGYDFNNGVDYNELFKSYLTMGIQGTHLSRAIDIVNKMLRAKGPEGEKCVIFLGVCSSVITSGMREIVRFLCEKKLVDVIVTTGGAIEEDIMKCLESHLVGDFEADDETLLKENICRQGNILIPEKNLEKFDEFFNTVLEEMHEEETKNQFNWTPANIVKKLGEKIDNKESFCYWANKNEIPVYAPAITDGRMGDIIYKRYLKKLPNPKIDVIEDIRALNGFSMKLKKTGCIILGGGVIKHHVFNANLMRNGTDYCVIINTGEEYDASDSGAKPTEALSWGKIRLDAEYVKVSSELSLVLPILVAESFYKFNAENLTRDN
jgi:deoxyhypusine synthase